MFKPLKTARSTVRNVALGLIVTGLIALLAGCAATGSRSGDHPAFAWDQMQAERQAAPLEPYWPYRMAEGYQASGNTAAAHAQLDTALTLSPNYVPAIILLSQLHYDGGQYESAVALLQEALANQTEQPDVLRVALALNLQALGEPDQAADVLANCDKQSGPTNTARIAVMLQSEDFQSSLPAAQAAVAANPQSAANHNNLGISLLYAGHATEARTAFLKALELAPELPGALYNLAIVENFYFFDRDTSQDYFERYQTAARRQPAPDPDDLASILDGAETGLGAQALLSEPAKGGAYE